MFSLQENLKSRKFKERLCIVYMGLWLRSNEINIKCREILCEAIFNWDSAV
jgi:hypothetical protein